MRVIVDANFNHIVADLFIAFLVVDFAQLGLLVPNVPDHSTHGQAQVFAFFE